MSIKPHNIAAALILAACTPAPLPETTADTTSTSTSTPPLPPLTTDDPTTTSTGSSSTTSTNLPSSFLTPPDGGPFTPECNLWHEDCPFGQKCMPYSSDGDNSWDSYKCVNVVPDPDGVGEPCMVFGSPVSGEDTCEIHMMCLFVDFDTLTGTCIAMCIGSPEAPTCTDPTTTCTISGDGVLVPCLPQCDPIAQDCPAGDLCIPHPSDPDNFVCVLDASEDGHLFAPCEYANACDPGLYCVNPELAAECDLQALGCCLPFCDTDDPNTCPGQGQQCIPWHDQGQAPSGHEDVGLCQLPQP